MPEVLGFIREFNEREIKIREAELARNITEKDIPKCFGHFLEGEPGCGKCLIVVSCSKWRGIYSSGAPVVSAPTAKEKDEETVTEPEQTSEPAKPKRASRAKPKKEEKPAPVKKEKKAAKPSVEKAKPAPVKKEKKPKAAGAGSDDKYPKGYVAGVIREMLAKGTTKEKVNKVLDEVGRGHAQFGYMLGLLRKAGKLEEDKETGVLKSKD
jgi:hypothetical protein